MTPHTSSRKDGGGALADSRTPDDNPAFMAWVRELDADNKFRPSHGFALGIALAFHNPGYARALVAEMPERLSAKERLRLDLWMAQYPIEALAAIWEKTLEKEP